jgi:hypothetical protein
VFRAWYCICDAKASLPLEVLCGSSKEHETKAQYDNRDHGEAGDYIKQVGDRDIIILGWHANPHLSQSGRWIFSLSGGEGGRRIPTIRLVQVENQGDVPSTGGGLPGPPKIVFPSKSSPMREPWHPPVWLIDREREGSRGGDAGVRCIHSIQRQRVSALGNVFRRGSWV